MDQTDQTLKGGGGGADSLLGDSSNTLNPQSQDSLDQSTLSLPSGYYRTRCIIVSATHSMKSFLEIRTIRYPDSIEFNYTFYEGTSCDTPRHVFMFPRVITDNKPNFGNNTSYFTIPRYSSDYDNRNYLGNNHAEGAFPFHIDDNGTLYIGHTSYDPSSMSRVDRDGIYYVRLDFGSGGTSHGGFILGSNSIVEDVFSDFINDPTSGFKYIPVPSELTVNAHLLTDPFLNDPHGDRNPQWRIR